MAVNATPVVTAVAVHRKASSACCGDRLQLAAPGAEHGQRYECGSCGQPTQKVLGEPEVSEGSEG